MTPSSGNEVGEDHTSVLPQPQLSVIMPAYNEEAAIADVVCSWVKELDALEIEYELRVYDDGSRDRTGAVVGRLAAGVPRVVVIGQANRGHGPTILRGYREARGDWVFQTDSDGEMPATEFWHLWSRRDEYDFLIGYRQNRRSDLSRHVISTAARVAVGALFEAGIRDVNSPYRLMRRSWLRAALPLLPEAAFAPNVLLAGLAARGGLRIYEHPVPYRARRTGVHSLVRYRLWSGALRALVQTVAVATRSARDRSR